MAHSDTNRPTLRPTGRLASHSIQPVSLPLESDPPSGDIAGEDFLYHLSRGSELLKENLVEEAKEALEVAFSLQPKDVRGQGLLGVVYFRLGMYPRAIDIYRQLVDAFSDEVTPKVNLALCYVKTGQQQAARELLEDVVQRDPAHGRAWAYLGLVFQFLRDYPKAEAAFERAGQQGMAERMRHLANPSDVAPEETLIAPEPLDVRAAAPDAFGEEPTPGMQRPCIGLRDWLVRRAASVRGGWAADVDARTLLVELDEPFAVRATAVVVVSPREIAKREIRLLCRARSTEEGEPLGGMQSPIIGFVGPGMLLARAEAGTVELFELDGDSVTVRQTALFGLSLELRYVSERIKLGRNDSVEVVCISGRGIVALNLCAEAKTLELPAGGLVVRLGELIGWTAGVLPEIVDPAEAPGRARDFVALTGEGAAIVA